MTITLTIPRTAIRLTLLAVAALAIVAFLLALPSKSPNTALGLHAMPCADLDGDTLVTEDDVNIVISYDLQAVPPAPAQADMNGDTVIDLVNDILFVTFQVGTTTNCQDTPIVCKGGPCAPEPRDIQIDNFGQYRLPKSCFDVADSAQTYLFTVCDNDFQGVPANHAACNDGTDTVCDDEDSALGSINVLVQPDTYHVTVSKVPQFHTADTSKEICDAPTTSFGCDVMFANTSQARPWFPWDVAGLGQTWPPDGVVTLQDDILGVILHFMCNKGENPPCNE